MTEAEQGLSDVGLDGIGQISIAVHNLERAVEFYRDTRGVTFLFQAPPGLAFFDCGGVRLMLTLPDGEGGQDHGTSNIYYRVDDIVAASRALEQRGVGLERQPERVAKLPDREIWMAFFRDPDHNLLALMSEIPVA